MSILADKAPWLGLYLPLNDTSSYLKRAFQYSHILKRDIRVLSFYIAWGNGTEPDLSGIAETLNCGIIPMLTWEPWRLPRDPSNTAMPQDQPEFALEEILRGRYDEYIRRWAIGLKTVTGPVLFRPMHEMNGNWYPWCGTVNGNTPEKYVETWRYLRSIFRKASSHRLLWVWCPYAHSVPETSGNEIWQYFPGEEEVDVVAIDGYNWGTCRPWSTWQSFGEIFGRSYGLLSEIAAGKPVMIAEMGSAETGGDKGEWLEEAFDLLKTKFDKIRGLIWFNMNKECDWRIESSIRSFRAFRKGLAKW